MKSTKTLILLFVLATSMTFAQDNKPSGDANTNKTESGIQKKEAEDKKMREAKTEDEKEKARIRSLEKHASPVAQSQPMSQEEMTKMSNLNPGSMHKFLADKAGVWNMEIQYWPKPMETPVLTKGKCTITMILGGRYQKSESKGMMADMPFEGQGIVGYSNARRKYQSTWIDNLGTSITNMEGIFDEKQNYFEFVGKTIDNATSKEIEAIQTIKFINKDEMTMELFLVKEGQKTKTMEINYKRIVEKKPSTKK